MGLVKQWQLEEAERELAEYEQRRELEDGPDWEMWDEIQRQLDEEELQWLLHEGD